VSATYYFGAALLLGALAYCLGLWAAQGSSTPYDTVMRRVRAEPDLAWSWHCVLAMCLKDNAHGMSAREANWLAAELMLTAFAVDTRDNAAWRHGSYYKPGDCDPVREDPYGWWYWDEVWCDKYGPYSDEETCRAALSAYVESNLNANASDCGLAAQGWQCTRPAGHGGPCAAVPEDGDGVMHPVAAAEVRAAATELPCGGVCSAIATGHCLCDDLPKAAP
jgi:hypothetical protein